MNTCEQLAMVSSYFDGEVVAQDRPAFEAHLRQCPACAAELAQLQGLSLRLTTAAAGMPALRPLTLARVHDAIERRRSVSELARLARSLSAVAAAILVGCLLWMAAGGSGGAQTSPMGGASLDSEAITMASDPTSTTVSPETQLAQFIVHDLGGAHE